MLWHVSSASSRQAFSRTMVPFKGCAHEIFCNNIQRIGRPPLGRRGGVFRAHGLTDDLWEVNSRMQAIGHPKLSRGMCLFTAVCTAHLRNSCCVTILERKNEKYFTSPVETREPDVLLPRALLRLHQPRRAVYAHDEAPRHLGVESAAVPGFFHAEDALDPCHNLVVRCAGWMGWDGCEYGGLT